MKKLISISFFFVILLAVAFVACNKEKKITKEIVPPTFKTDFERDANASTLVRLISQDDDWKALRQLNYEFLDVLVKSDVPVRTYMTHANNKDSKKLNNKVYLAKLEKAKRLAKQIKNKYFQDSKQCYSCETMTEAKWKLFAEKINTFRSNRIAYKEFLMKLGANTENSNDSATASAEFPNCNNWRFSLCAAACVLTAPTGILFAACMALCIAEYC